MMHAERHAERQQAAYLQMLFIVKAHEVSTPEACPDCPRQEVLIQLSTSLCLEPKLATQN